MADETQQVLEMVASGKITPEQAEVLLDAMRDDPARPVAEPVYRAPHTRQRRQHARKSLRPSVAELADAAKFGVDAEFIQAVAQAGYPSLSLGELTELAKFGADADFMSSLQAAGYSNLSVEELEDLAKFGVDGDFIEKMRRAGLTDLSVEELVELGRSGVDEEIIRVLRARGHVESPIVHSERAHAEDDETYIGEER